MLQYQNKARYHKKSETLNPWKCGQNQSHLKWYVLLPKHNLCPQLN